MLPGSIKARRHGVASDAAAGLLSPRHSAVAHAMEGLHASAVELLRQIGRAPADNDHSERDSHGNRFLHLKDGGTVVLRPHDAEEPERVGATMPRPVSLGEVLGWSPAQKMGLTLPHAPHCANLQSPDHCVLSTSWVERFILRHGDHYGHVEVRRSDGIWEPIAPAADYMPAGAGRRYLREVGNRYGEFQRCLGGIWMSERAHGKQVRLYLIDGQFEMLTDEQYVLRHGAPTNTSSRQSLA